jgi:hypothetical protein
MNRRRRRHEERFVFQAGMRFLASAPRSERYAPSVRPGIETFVFSARTGEKMPARYDRIARKRASEPRFSK